MPDTKTDYTLEDFFFSFQIWHLELNINGDGSLPLEDTEAERNGRPAHSADVSFGKGTLDILRLQTRGRAQGGGFYTKEVKKWDLVFCCCFFMKRL